MNKRLMFILSSLLFSLVTIASHGQGKGGAVSLDLKNASVVDCKHSRKYVRR